MDILAYQAKEAHRQCREHSDRAGRFRVERDRLIKQLYRGGGYSYGQLARQIGCSPELVAKVVQGRQGLR